jgi:CRISPR/Cas system CSM-associated protein Csm3 (group 7 of RAMP superfamily)
MTFDAYWQLEGTLTTESPMHIGNGESRPDEVTKEEDSKLAEVQLITRDIAGKPIIPGSALKGALKRRYTAPPEIGEAVFGVMKSGGLVQFLDATSSPESPIPEDIERRTKIDAIRGTAEEHLLFAHQTVPVGTAFNVRIRGKSYEAGEWKKHAALLEQALSGGVYFGAGDSNNRGRCHWELSAVRVMDREMLAVWLKTPKPIDSALGELKDRKEELENIASPMPSARSKRIEIRLTFKDQCLLVMDAKKTKKKVGNEAGIAHGARRTIQDRLVLPASGFRGVLAHRAAKIARTYSKLGDRQDVKLVAGSLPAGIGCVTQLFGGPGWKTVIGIKDFIEVKPTTQLHINSKTLQGVAIDRFTAAGGMDGRKFNAEGGWKPVLTGAITINLDRLGKFGNLTECLGLLALVLRDLAEGDLTFGWGGGKGYGRATIAENNACKWVSDQLAGVVEGDVKDWIQAWTEKGI